jgi:hypothetical protein
MKDSGGIGTEGDLSDGQREFCLEDTDQLSPREYSTQLQAKHRQLLLWCNARPGQNEGYVHLLLVVRM